MNLLNKESGEAMTFEEFQPLCRYYAPGHDGKGDFEDTCRKPDRRPPGHSWEKCREDYCPYFGIKINVKDAKVFHEGKEVATIKELAIAMYKSTGKSRDKYHKQVSNSRKDIG